MRCGDDLTALVAVRKSPFAAVSGGGPDVWRAEKRLAKVLSRVFVAIRVAAAEGEKRPVNPFIRCCMGSGGGGRR